MPLAQMALVLRIHRSKLVAFATRRGHRLDRGTAAAHRFAHHVGTVGTAVTTARRHHVRVHSARVGVVDRSDDLTPQVLRQLSRRDAADQLEPRPAPLRVLEHRLELIEPDAGQPHQHMQMKTPAELGLDGPREGLNKAEQALACADALITLPLLERELEEGRQIQLHTLVEVSRDGGRVRRRSSNPRRAIGPGSTSLERDAVRLRARLRCDRHHDVEALSLLIAPQVVEVGKVDGQKERVGPPHHGVAHHVPRQRLPSEVAALDGTRDMRHQVFEGANKALVSLTRITLLQRLDRLVELGQVARIDVLGNVPLRFVAGRLSLNHVEGHAENVAVAREPLRVVRAQLSSPHFNG
mmetsp:Transcript_99966/g.285751  ORF Transcript_99966/g.285751 Transcript_99966/m.285751 type:complete len:354 (-) Transcript_99966:4210-5271(-)